MGFGTPPTAPLTGNTILKAIQQFKGLFWFNNNWLPAGMIEYGDSGTGGSGVGWTSAFVRPMTGDISGGYSFLRKEGFGLSGAFSWAKKRYFGAYVGFETLNDEILHLVSGGIYFPSESSNPRRHIGFKLINDHLYGTVADGTTEAEHLLEILTDIGWRRLECILTPGVECRFFVDGVDKGAITTNLPTGTTDANYLLYCSLYNTVAVNKVFRLYELRVFQEE